MNPEMTLDDIDLIIPSQSPLGFADNLKKRLGMNDNFVELEKTGNMVFHTAGLAFALKKVWDDNRFQKFKEYYFPHNRFRNKCVTCALSKLK